MNSSETLTDPLNWIASITMVVNAIFGIICNFLIVYIFLKFSTERNSFNLICAYRAVINSFILTFGFLITFVPITLIGDNLVSDTWQYIVITTVNSLYMSLQYLEIIVGINRFCAMFFPFFYAKFFNLKMTALIVFIVFIYRVTKVAREAVVAIPLKCFTTYSAFDLSWSPNFRGECRPKGDGIVNTTALFLGVLLAINIATFSKIWMFYKSTETCDVDVKRKMRKNNILFVQTLLQDGTYLIDMIFTYKLSRLSTERYWTFISGSLVWETVHTFDGCIMIMFNERLSLIRQNFFRSTEDPPSVIPWKKTQPLTHRSTLVVS